MREHMTGTSTSGHGVLTHPRSPWAERLRIPRSVTRLLHASPLRLALLAALGALAALIVAVVTAHNPQAGPTHGAVVIRVSIIVTLIAAGLYAQTSRLQTRMGSLLVTVGFVSSL